MFETSVVKARAAAAPRRVGLFTVSVALHSLAGIAIVAASIASVDFPRSAPDQYELFQTAAPVMIPPPLGNPNGGGPKPPDVKPAAAPIPPRPNQETAPQTIPENVTPAAQPGPSTTDNVLPGTGGEGPGTEPGPFGDPNGDPNMPNVGQPIVSTPGTAPSGPLVPGGEVKSAVVLRRVEPQFPAGALAIRKGGTVVVQCVIDRSGTCQSPRVIRSTFAMFDQPVLNAVKQWKFLPGSLRGQPVDTYFELTVTFTPR